MITSTVAHVKLDTALNCEMMMNYAAAYMYFAIITFFHIL
jgi:hypothetical protein